ncbi:hypothetical protein MNBD_GAMMA10-3344 [hydrothermal vent metagenome]|uniref:Uncharacterized protein n=1 Tax=hydrothermal vent metagenome TaxID=652676 RepID=A0A3B0XBR1_9ZZZZ
MPNEYDENDEKSLDIAKAAIEEDFSDSEVGEIVQSCGPPVSG